MESFADLLQRARIRHRTKISTDRLVMQDDDVADDYVYIDGDDGDGDDDAVMTFVLIFLSHKIVRKEAKKENKASARKRSFTKSCSRFYRFPKFSAISYFFLGKS